MELATLIISALTLVATIAGIVVAIVLFRLQRKYDIAAEQERLFRERRDAQEELDAMGINGSGFSLVGYSKAEVARAKLLMKKVGRL